MAGLERRWAQEREKHERQVQPWRFFAARGPRRSATTTPSRLRYWSYAPPRTWVLLTAAVVVGGYLIYLGLSDNASAGSNLGRLLAVVALLVLVSVTRITVSHHGVSFDIAGIRAQHQIHGRGSAGQPRDDHADAGSAGHHDSVSALAAQVSDLGPWHGVG